MAPPCAPYKRGFEVLFLSSLAPLRKPNKETVCLPQITFGLVFGHVYSERERV